MNKLSSVLVLAVLACWVLGCGGPNEAAGGGGGANVGASGDAGGTPKAIPPITMAKAYLADGGARSFQIEYTAHVEKIPAGTKELALWVPVPSDSTAQTITNLAFDAPVKEKVGVEKGHGNRVAYFEIPNPGDQVQVVMRFDCRREEIKTDLEKLAAAGEDDAKKDEARLQPERLVVVNDHVKQIANEAAGDKETTLEKARGLYDRVMHDMTYDKSGTGWGRGDTMHACDSGKGNCTDFHALFISLCRSQGIPADFQIGLFLPYEEVEGASVGGYHCWAWFQVPGRTWVPVDISEADKDPERTDYFFGALTPNRVTLSRGRDIVLEPPQKGEPLNYFLAPYAEADGAPVDATKTWTYQDK